ncbi:hypothetical protein GCM10027515_28560 [Schumannella luteola]|uniref:Uncharacterized protein n=1 Tax=Schumannella luteola TaxID=472059 RepID=A0A852YQ57_9MICO|nr:hypothetical protein [Schumannella luteola]NYG99345.1 hypothetical protein [Schumannella luteola]TPX06075.1 hypothetical protein FJ656_02775 [Schumannella luteola]
MSSDEFHPELAEYVPNDRPLRGPRYGRTLRIVVIVAVLALIVPGAAGTILTQARTAEFTCASIVERAAGEYTGVVKFELGSEGPGWYCYAEGFDGRQGLYAALGLIPYARTR